MQVGREKSVKMHQNNYEQNVNIIFLPFLSLTREIINDSPPIVSLRRIKRQDSTFQKRGVSTLFLNKNVRNAQKDN
jgi:hypothetical protein